MSQDNKPSRLPDNLLVDYNDTNIPMSRRLTGLGLQSGVFGVVGFTLGTVCGVIPRAVEAVVTSRRQSNPIPPLRLIRLGAVANGAFFGIVGSSIGPAQFLLSSCGVPADPSGSLARYLTGCLTGCLVMLAAWPLQARMERLWKARGVPMGGAADIASVALAAVGFGVIEVWGAHQRGRVEILENELYFGNLGVKEWDSLVGRATRSAGKMQLHILQTCRRGSGSDWLQYVLSRGIQHIAGKILISNKSLERRT